VACESVSQALCDLLMEFLGGLALLDSELAAGAAEFPDRVAMLSVPRHPEPRHEPGLAPRPFNDRGAEVLRFAKPTFTKPAPVDLRHEIATRCEAVVEALAD
jgi:hypothetical protein